MVHELAHVLQSDARARLGWDVLRAIYWPNPLVWLAARRARVDQERAADDRVLRSGTSPVAYAEQLVALARGSVGGPAFALGIVPPSRSPIKVRVRAILDDATNHRAASRRATIAHSAGITAAAALIAAGSAVAATEAIPTLGAAVVRAVAAARTNVNDSTAWAPTASSSASDSITFRLLFASAPRDRQQAATIASRIGRLPVTNVLLSALDDSVAQCASMRWRAARGLRDLRDPRALPRLVGRLVADSSLAVRAMAATAIGAVGSQDGARLLRHMMVGESSQSFARVATALESLGPTPAYYRLRRALLDARTETAIGPAIAARTRS
jgi:hypothetical protein